MASKNALLEFEYSQALKHGKKIGIIGSRTRDSFADMKLVILAFTRVYKHGDWIVSGGCPKGGDRFAKAIYTQYEVPYIEFPAQWASHGKQAGLLRNALIAEYSDILIACVALDRKGGTEDTLRRFTGPVHLV